MPPPILYLEVVYWSISLISAFLLSLRMQEDSFRANILREFVGFLDEESRERERKKLAKSGVKALWTRPKSHWGRESKGKSDLMWTIQRSGSHRLLMITKVPPYLIFYKPKTTKTYSQFSSLKLRARLVEKFE